jgi:hypothetical protein
MMEELILPGAYTLNIGFDPPGCGNAYMGPEGKRLAKRVAEEGRMAEESVAISVFRVCPQLKKLWVGDRSCGEVSRDDQGNVTEIKWFYQWREAPSGWVV